MAKKKADKDKPFEVDDDFFGPNRPDIRGLLTAMPDVEIDADGTWRRIVPKIVVSLAMSSLEHAAFWLFLWSLLLADKETGRTHKKTAEANAMRPGTMFVELGEDRPHTVRIWFIPDQRSLNDKVH